ncbi:MAG: hypothetical protein L0Y64_27015, partial [Myxococcaceae bacterium]|nr:hypothetical protein [Myxococcaceae bacterium]
MNADLPSWGAGDPNEPLPWCLGTVDESERAVVGCCLLPLGNEDQRALVRWVMRTLPAAAWRDPRHWRILRMLGALSGPGALVAWETVAHHLQGVVGAQYIEDLALRFTDTVQRL